MNDLMKKARGKLSELPEPKDYFPNLEKEKKDEWNGIFKESGHRLVRIRHDRIWKVFGILFFVFLFGSFGFICYGIQYGYFNGIISSSVNVTTENEFYNDVLTENSYTFNPLTENEFDINLEVNIDESVRLAICGE